MHEKNHAMQWKSKRKFAANGKDWWAKVSTQGFFFSHRKWRTSGRLRGCCCRHEAVHSLGSTVHYFDIRPTEKCHHSRWKTEMFDWLNAIERLNEPSIGNCASLHDESQTKLDGESLDFRNGCRLLRKHNINQVNSSHQSLAVSEQHGAMEHVGRMRNGWGAFRYGYGTSTGTL